MPLYLKMPPLQKPGAHEMKSTALWELHRHKKQCIMGAGSPPPPMRENKNNQSGPTNEFSSSKPATNMVHCFAGQSLKTTVKKPFSSCFYSSCQTRKPHISHSLIIAEREAHFLWMRVPETHTYVSTFKSLEATNEVSQETFVFRRFNPHRKREIKCFYQKR